MAIHSERIAQAWLTSPDAGIVELNRDWTAGALPPLTFGPGEVPKVQIERVPDHSFGAESGYFANAFDEIFFFLPRSRYPDIDPGKTAVYLAGDFNGWQNAVGQPDWRMLPASLDGEPVFLFAARAGRFFSQPAQRFKFVTGEHRWLPVPAQAPNAVRDSLGNYNYAINPERTGRHLFRFAMDRPVDLSRALVVGWADDPAAGTVPLRPGDFFFQRKSYVRLGAEALGDETVFRVFAPRASAVRLHLCSDLKQRGKAAAYAMDRRSDGAWEATLDGNLDGWYYWYTVDGPANAYGLFDPKQPILDPYAFAAVSREGPGIVVDRSRLARPADPFRTPPWQDLVIAEAHVRDLAAKAPIDLSPAERAGFTGLRKWVESPDFHLAALGVNAVELQPILEADNARPSEYHWGYMPVSWFAPASSYALAPEQGSQIREFQELVAAFHRRGMAVLLDLVYNHVGVPAHLMAIDKLYYFEQDAEGKLSNWSGCGNDIRPGAAMTRKLVIDSLTHLIEVYGVDGFRFDLAELLGMDLLREIEAALKRVKPDVVLIAEPWSFRGYIAQDLMRTRFASWNDGYRNFMREFVRGGGSREGFAHFLKGSPESFAAWPAQSVNYTESHDDKTWIDLITENADGNGMQPTLHDCRRTHLMGAILMASIGIPMLATGQDFMRSKMGVHNTYQRGDLNAIDYRRLYAYPSTHAFFADWIEFRRSEKGRLLRQFTRPGEGFFRFCHASEGTATAVVYNADGSQEGPRLLFAVNPTLQDAEIQMGDNVRFPWRQLADHDRFFGAGNHEPRRPVAPSLFMPALGCGLWIAE